MIDEIETDWSKCVFMGTDHPLQCVVLNRKRRFAWNDRPCMSMFDICARLGIRGRKVAMVPYF